MSSAVAHIRDMMASVALPLGYSWQLGGLYESQQASFRSLMMVAAVAVLLVFGLLVAQFRRFRSAIVILSVSTAVTLVFVPALLALVERRPDGPRA